MERIRQIERTCANAASGLFARGGRGGGGHGCVTFGTSIWDETLFKAWSQIVQMLLPNAGHVGLALNRLADALDSDELILFEKSTFLVRICSTPDSSCASNCLAVVVHTRFVQ